MALHQRDVEITRPCPVDLDPGRTRGGAKSWYCGHCEKAVHILSNMTESEARRLLEAEVGAELCVTYAVRPDGSIRFAPEPPPAPIVPVASLTRPRSPAAASLAAASLGVALAACTPHQPIELRSDVQADTPVVQGTDFVTIPDAPCETKNVPPPAEPEERVVDGGIGLERRIEPEPQIAVPGGIRVKALPEPEPRPPIRGGIRRMQRNAERL